MLEVVLMEEVEATAHAVLILFVRMDGLEEGLGPVSEGLQVLLVLFFQFRYFFLLGLFALLCHK